MISATLNSAYPLLLAPTMDIGLLTEMKPAAGWNEVNLNNLGATILTLLPGEQTSVSAGWYLVLVSVVLFSVAGIAAGGVEYLALTLSGHLTWLANRDLQVALNKRLVEQEMGFFVNSRTGDLANRLLVDAVETMNSIDVAIRQGLQAALQVLIYGWLLLKTSPSLAIATIAVSFVHLLINKFLGQRLKDSVSSRFETLATVVSALQEAIMGMRVIKSLGAEAHEHRRFSKLAETVRRSTANYLFIKHSETPLRKATDVLAIASLLLLAYQALQAGEMTFQGFVLFMVVVRLTIVPVSGFAQAMTRMKIGLGSAGRVLELLERRPQLADGGKTIPSGMQTSIRFENVAFGYAPERSVFKGINLELRKGELLAVVGASGAGKSTLVDLLLRLYDPDQGRITLDGVDIREYRQSEYRRLFGVVSQDNLLFNDTIRNNIVFGRETGREQDLIHSVSIANAAEFIDRLPERYETITGDRGLKLSGGQRQRIAIARAIYASPAILVLDEATSALDSESERAVQEAIDKVLTNSTAIVIAHRLATILHADRIVVMQDGGIAAIGKHADLLQNNEYYRRLCDMQFRSFDNAAPYLPPLSRMP